MRKVDELKESEMGGSMEEMRVEVGEDCLVYFWWSWIVIYNPSELLGHLHGMYGLVQVL